MKEEVGRPVFIAIIVVVVLIVAVVGWKMFGASGAAPAVPTSSDAAGREAHFKEHPEDRAMYEHKTAAPVGGGNSRTGMGGSPGYSGGSSGAPAPSAPGGH